jgi:serine/threonine protein kinase
MRGDYEFESPYWDDISAPAKDLVTSMITVEAGKRPTAAQALQSPWVKGHTAQDLHLKRTQDRIREFNAKRKFKVGDPNQTMPTASTSHPTLSQALYSFFQAATHAVLATTKFVSGSASSLSGDK